MVKHSDSDVALVGFFINLTKRLEALGNAPGIRLETYYKGMSRLQEIMGDQ